MKEATGHLKGVTIAVMDVSSTAPAKWRTPTLDTSALVLAKSIFHVGKNRVKSSIRETEAVDRLVDLIQDEGKWIDLTLP